MGNQFVAPSKDCVKSDEIRANLLEYRKISLAQLEDAYTYWQCGSCDGNTKLPLSGFEEVFSGILADPETHFYTFSDYAGIAVNPQEIFLVLALLVDCASLNRLTFLLRVALRVPKDNQVEILKTKDLQNFVLLIIQAAQKLFDVKAPEAPALNFHVSSGLFSYVERTSTEATQPSPPKAVAVVAANNSGDAPEAEADENGDPAAVAVQSGGGGGGGGGSSDVQMTVAQFWGWTQDSQEASALMHFAHKYFLHQSSDLQVLDAAAPGGDVVTESEEFEECMAGMTAVRVDASVYEFLQRNQNPIWTNTVLDMADDSWCNDLPQLYAKDTVYTALEHIILSTTYEDGGALTNSIPIYRKKESRTLGAGVGAGRAYKVPSPAATSSAAAATSQPKEKRGKASTISQFNLMAPSNPNAPTSVNSAPVLLQAGMCAAMASSASAILQAQATGGIIDIFDATSMCALLAGACPEGIVDESLDPKNEGKVSQDGYNLQWQHQQNRHRNQASEYERWTQIGLRLANSSLEEVPDCPFLQYRPRVVSEQVLHTDHQAYNAIELIAQRHRAIPVASDPEVPFHVTHVLTGLNVAKFLCRNDVELFGKDLTRPVLDVGLVRISHNIPFTANLGTALTILARLDTEAALVTNESGGVCGIVAAEDLREFWRLWWVQSNPNQDRRTAETTIEELVELYQNGQFSHFDGNAKQGFTMFSTMASPLELCSAIGMGLEAFRTYSVLERDEMKAFLKKEKKPKNRNVSTLVRPGQALRQISKFFTKKKGGGEDGDSMSSSSSNSSKSSVDVSATPSKLSTGKKKKKKQEKAPSTAAAKAKTSPKKSKAKEIAGSNSVKASTAKSKKGKLAALSETAAVTPSGQLDASSAGCVLETIKAAGDTGSVVSATKSTKSKGSKTSSKGNKGGKEGSKSPQKGKKGGSVKSAGAGTGAKKGKKGKKGKKRKDAPLTAAQLEAKRLEEEAAAELAYSAAVIAHKAAYGRWLERWFTKHRAIRHNVSLQTALEKMCEYRCTKVFLISEETGLPSGSLNLTDLCRLVLEKESDTRIAEFEASRNRRADDYVVRATESFA